jgi:hypothetical protein
MKVGDSDQSNDTSEDPPALLVDYLLATEPGEIVLIACAAEDLHWPKDVDDSGVVKRYDTLESAAHRVQGSLPEDVGEQVTVLNVGSEESTFAQTMGQAVRAFPNRLIVYTSAQSVPDTLFFAFGFRKLNVLHTGSTGVLNRWFEFRLSHYKQPPEWLNARFWANPERFKLDDDSDLYFDPDDTGEEE